MCHCDENPVCSEGVKPLTQLFPVEHNYQVSVVHPSCCIFSVAADEPDTRRAYRYRCMSV